MAALDQPQGKFLTGSTLGHVVRMSLMGAVGITFVFLVDLANLFWISQLGETQLTAAIGFAFAVQFFSVSTGVGMMIATTALVSRHIGRGDMSKAREVATSSMIITVAFQATVAAIIIIWRIPLLEMVGARGETLELAQRYLFYSMPSLAIMAIGLSGTAVLRAEGDGRRAMFVTISAGIILMIIDPVLIYWMELGLDGAAIGIILFRIAIAVQALRYVIGTHQFLVRPRLASVVQALGPFFAVATPAMITQMATPFGLYILTSLVAPYGDTAVAGWAVVNRVSVVAFGGIFSLAGAIGGIFGQNYGAERWGRLQTTYRDSLIYCWVYSFVAFAVLALSAPLVITLFQLTDLGAEVYRAFGIIGSAGFILTGTIFVASSAFNTLGRPIWSTLVTWLRDGVLVLPIAWWFVQIYGAPGAVYGQALTGTLIGIFSGLWGWYFVRRLAHRGQASVAKLT